jgi:hypothetical protein
LFNHILFLLNKFIYMIKTESRKTWIYSFRKFEGRLYADLIPTFGIVKPASGVIR